MNHDDMLKVVRELIEMGLVKNVNFQIRRIFPYFNSYEVRLTKISDTQYGSTIALCDYPRGVKCRGRIIK